MITCFIATILFTLSVYMFLYAQAYDSPTKLAFLDTIKDNQGLQDAYNRIAQKRLQVYLMGGLVGSCAVILLSGLDDFRLLKTDTCLQVLSIMTVQFLVYSLYDYKEYMMDILETDSQKKAYEDLKEDMAVRYRTGLLVGLIAAIVSSFK